MGSSLIILQRMYLAGDHCPALSCTSIDTLAYPPNCQGGPGWSPACRSPVCGDRVRLMYSTPFPLTGLISPASEPSSTELPIMLILSWLSGSSAVRPGGVRSLEIARRLPLSPP